MNTADKSPWIVETTDERFEQDVLERSDEVTVVVDFWADWCQPCRLLGPLLEQLAEEHAGLFVLAKANTELTPVAASQFRVQSIPAVYAVRQRAVVDGFVGALPEAELRSWLDRVLPSTAERFVQEALELQATDADGAEQRFRAAMTADPNLAPAAIRFAEFLVERQRFEEAGQVVATLEQRGFLEPEAERVKAILHRHSQSAAAGHSDSIRQKLADSPQDVALKLQLADALIGESQYEAALEVCLDVVRTQQGEPRETARQTMVEVFRLLPEESELVRDYRRKLSMALY